MRQDLPDAADWDRVMAWWDKAIGSHQRAGVQYIVQPWMGARGKMDFERFFQYRELSGVQYLIVEQEKYSFDPIPSVAKSLQFMMDAPFVE